VRQRDMSRILALGVALAFAGTGSSAEAGDGRDLLTAMPAGVKLLLGVDLARARGSAVFKSYMADLKKDPARKKRYDNFVQKAGFDPSTEVDTLLIGTTLDQTAEQEIVVIAKGNVSEAKVRKALKKQEGKLLDKKHKGVRYQMSTKSGQQFGVAVVEGHIVLAFEPQLKRTIDLIKGGKGKSSASDADLKRMVAASAPGSAAWLVATLPEQIRTKAAKGPAASLSAAREVRGDVRLAGGLDLTLVFGCEDDDTAAGLNQLLGLALFEVQANPALKAFSLGGLLGKLKMSVKGKELTMELAMSEAEMAAAIDTLARTVEQQQAAKLRKRPPKMLGAPTNAGRPLQLGTKKGAKKGAKKTTKKATKKRK
jgi:hypothetical protein